MVERPPGASVGATTHFASSSGDGFTSTLFKHNRASDGTTLSSTAASWRRVDMSSTRLVRMMIYAMDESITGAAG
jgi:hypothetical protein